MLETQQQWHNKVAHNFFLSPAYIYQPTPSLPMGMRCGMQLVLRMILFFRYSVRHMHERVDNFVDIQLCPKLHTFADGTGVVEDMKEIQPKTKGFPASWGSLLRKDYLSVYVLAECIKVLSVLERVVFPPHWIIINTPDRETIFRTILVRFEGSCAWPNAGGRWQCALIYGIGLLYPLSQVFRAN